MHFDAVERSLALQHNRKSTFERKFWDGEAGLSTRAPAAVKPNARLRRFFRHRFDARIQVSVFREGRTTTFWGRTSELGQDGLGATLSGELHADEVVSLEFPIPLPPHIMKMRASVRYNDGLRCGLEFLVMSSEQRLILRQVCVVLANIS